MPPGCWPPAAPWVPEATEPPAVPCACCGTDVSDDTTARSVCASLVASAFFRYTTWTLPASAVGWSSLLISDLARLARAADGARTITELVRGSASTETRPESPPGAGSIMRLTITATSLATA